MLWSAHALRGETGASSPGLASLVSQADLASIFLLPPRASRTGGQHLLDRSSPESRCSFLVSPAIATLSKLVDSPDDCPEHLRVFVGKAIHGVLCGSRIKPISSTLTKEDLEESWRKRGHRWLLLPNGNDLGVGDSCSSSEGFFAEQDEEQLRTGITRRRGL